MCVCVCVCVRVSRICEPRREQGRASALKLDEGWGKRALQGRSTRERDARRAKDSVGRTLSLSLSFSRLRKRKKADDKRDN